MADEPLQGHIKPSEHINKQFARWEARERGGWQYLARDRREFITLLGGAVSVFLCVSAAAQEGYYGVGHDKWHQGFYSKLKRNDGQGSCCNLMDCRPTQSRMVGDHYEVKVDGAWTPVPYDQSTERNRAEAVAAAQCRLCSTGPFQLTQSLFANVETG